MPAHAPGGNPASTVPAAPRDGGRAALGRLGERLAETHLERRGFATLARNVRTRHGEIDLIVHDGSVLAFVEVKTLRARAGGAPVAPLEGLRGSQRARLRRLAAAWLGSPEARPSARTIRFDAIGVVLDRRGALLRLDHIEGAW